MVVLAPATPVTQAQKRALAAYILRKRAGYAKKDAAIKAKFKWLEDLNQTDPDLEGIEISERSLEELRARRVAMGEEKHQLFEKLKNLLAQDDEDDPQPTPADAPNYNSEQPGTSYQPSYAPYPPYPQPTYPPPTYPPPNTAYPQPPYFQPRPRFDPPRFEPQPPRFPLQTEPITPKKPSELSPTRSRSLLSRGESPPKLPLWEDVSPGHSPRFTPKTPVVTESKESRINSFTKAFSESLNKAMLCEQAIKSESPVKVAEVKEKVVEKKEAPKLNLDIKVPEPKSKISEVKRPSSVTSNEPKKASGGVSVDGKRSSGGVSVEGKKTPAEGTRTPGGDSRRTSSVTSETKRSSTSEHSAHTPTSGVSPKTQLVSPPYKSKSPNIKREVEKRREEREKCDQGDGEMAPVIRISKAEIHSKVMSWPTERTHTARRDTGAGSKTPATEQKKGKKDEKDGSGSSLLEFAFQSALFGNNLFNEAQAASPGGGKVAKEPATPSTPATTSGTSDLLAALSLSYGSKKTASAEVHVDTRKRARSPSPELVEVYQHKTKSPPPPPPPPPKPGRKVPPSSTPTSTTSNAPPTSPHQAAAVCYPPFRSPSHAPTSPYPFLSPTMSSSQQLTSPMHSSPVIGSPLLAGYNSPSHRSPSMVPGMLAMPVPAMMPPPGMPPRPPTMPLSTMPPMPPPGLPTMPPPGCPGMLQHPGQLKNRNYNRYNYQ